jgi:alpha-L-rhamnosidase
LLLGSALLMLAAEANRVAITAHSAVGDGTTLNTVAIQQAIDAAEGAGGGVVEIPAGTVRSGSIFLKKGFELWLAEGAVLLGSTDIADYPKRETRIEGHFEPWRMALVNAQSLERVRIGGKGVLNGKGVPFWGGRFGSGGKRTRSARTSRSSARG